MKLYFSPGACSLSPHIVLRETGVPFELEQVDLRAKKTQSGADFLQVNPKGQVPVLTLDDGDRLTEGHYSLPPFLIKTKAFEPECEFRVFVQTKNPTDSCDLDVDLNKLVHEIRISPLAPRWVDDAVRATLDPICDRLGIPKVADRERNLRE